MSKSNPTVLVVGAAGRFAGFVVPALVRRGVLVRALVRDQARAVVARRNGAQQIAIGDLRDARSLEAAAEKVDGVFHIGPAFVPDEAELGVRMVDVAKRAGAERFVFSSVIHVTNTRLANHASKVPVEDAIFASGMQYTILHPATFYQNIAGAWASVIAHGRFAEPFPATARIARVDYRDVAEVAAIALTEDRLAHGTFELSAGMLSRQDIVATMSAVLGRPIEAAEPNFEEWAASANLPLDKPQKELLAKVYRSYAEYGSGGNSLVLRAILGHEPRTLRGYIEELASQTQAGATRASA